MDKKNKGKMVEEDDTKELKPMFSCAICFKILDTATAIALTECLHRFCWKCISGEIIKHDWKCCLVCYADLGSQPLGKFRFGQMFFPEQEVVKTEFETSEVSSSSSDSSEDSSSSSDSSEAPEQEDMKDVNPSVHAKKKYKVTKE